MGLLINFGDVILKHASLVAISVMVPHPIAHVVVATGLIAALRREVEIVISADQYVTPAPVTGIGVKDVAGRVFVEHADAAKVLGRFLALVVSALNRSRSRVNSFSLLSSSLRAAIHSSRATITCSGIPLFLSDVFVCAFIVLR